MQFFIPEYVSNVITVIEKNGGEAYIVGGCVRDMLLSLCPSDFDVTTSLSPENIINCFDKTIATGIKHGTVTVISDKKSVEVTTYRTDGTYKDNRHPENVNFVKNIKEDLSRRDFTINAMAYNKKTGIVDLFGGQEDLKNKILRTVGNPYKRFNEDALRIMRLFRFSCQLGFNIEDSTYTAALNCAEELANISRERIASELFKALLSPYPERLSPLLQSGALEFCGINKGTVKEELASLPLDRDIRFISLINNLNAKGEVVCKELKTDKGLLKLCSETEELFNNPPKDIISCKKALKDYSQKAVFTSLLLTNNDTSVIEKIVNSKEPYKISHLNIDGNKLKALGISGVKTGEVLEKLINHVIEYPEDNTGEKLIKLI